MNTQIERAKQLIEEAYGILDKLDEGDETPQPVAVTGPVSPPAQPVVLKKGERSYTGKIGRPSFQKTSKGHSLWKAGLGVDRGDGTIDWFNIVAWRSVADCAQQFESGDIVTVVGKAQTNEFVDADGVLQQRENFVVSQIGWPEP